MILHQITIDLRSKSLQGCLGVISANLWSQDHYYNPSSRNQIDPKLAIPT